MRLAIETLEGDIQAQLDACYYHTHTIGNKSDAITILEGKCGRELNSRIASQVYNFIKRHQMNISMNIS